MISYLIVGSGYRSEYFARIAARYPHLFRALFLCRSAEKAEAVSGRTGVPAVCSLGEALAFRPDFAVAAVDREHVADVTEEWTERGYPVLAETPVGSSEEKLKRLWKLHRERGAKIVCCEQYHRYPVLAGGLELVRGGLIGTPVSAYLSLAHDYHGISLIRRMLMAEGESYTLRAVRTENEALATDSRYGAVLDGSRTGETRDTVFLQFSSGKTAVYDFSPLQYRSFIRSRHLTVRGDRGEWSDRVILYADEKNTPRRVYLMPELAPAYRALDTQTLRDGRKAWQPELFLDTAQDELAIASILLDMEAYLQGGPSPYPLEEAMEDACFWLLVNEAVKRPGEVFSSRPMPWNREEQA